jgi:hypothetical protein
LSDPPSCSSLFLAKEHSVILSAIGTDHFASSHI